MCAWNERETRALVVRRACSRRLETSAASVPEFSSCVDLRCASGIKHARNDAWLPASQAGGTEKSCASVCACLCAIWVQRGHHPGETGMNQMEVSSEELRSLPPRPRLLPAAPPKRRFARLGRKPSDGPQQWVWNKLWTNSFFFLFLLCCCFSWRQILFFFFRANILFVTL